ncbi:MAG: sugar ABC transporter ATP-binding protein [Verrucomicrobia bacterium]|nr:sugar ABC transporter ATP-binding protein [Verrucomicrobiota bacterium]MBV9643630.1 sugar ABC transporter ATP-binding protein [Verrucomicrobiota bacterium]
MKAKKPVLELRRVTKSYPGALALDAVNFTVWESEIVGLIGENGAGKSTLMKILIGLIQPDAGQYELRGNPVTLRDPANAARHGVGMVFQEGSLVPNLSIMENLFLSHEIGFRRFGFLSRRAMRETATSVLSLVKVTSDLDTPIADTTPAVRQMVEIARLMWLSRLYRQENPVLILDEPTTVLTEGERKTLFTILTEIKRQASIILISHRLQEIVGNSDRIVILKDGRNVTEFEAEHANIAEIENRMVGHTFAAERYRENEQIEPMNEIALEVRNLSKRGVFEPITFSLRKGEIVSLVGLVGSGKEAVCGCITGLEKPDSGTISLHRKKLALGSPSETVRAGIGHIPIDRRSEGLALGMTVADNVNLLVLDKLKAAGLINPPLEKKNALRMIEECRIKTPSFSAICANLSGGNQQKTVIAKWLSSKIQLLVLDHPTRGVDVGAKEEIYRLIRNLARDGISMIIMCDTLEEDIGLCNRMLVMKDGRLVSEMSCSLARKPNPSDIIALIV